MRASYICPSLSAKIKDIHIDYGGHRRGRGADMLQLEELEDHTLTQDPLREVQGHLNRMKQALTERLEISFVPAPPRDVPADDSETDDDVED
ncbi:hypothetical protein Scep_012349 [Stephania cephalantha]|uniref:Uncharacterized protein n=1 Tax=Stephania cephalantha TaxID=152367 RepID=A0AAP0P9S1_9MAGN